MDIDSEACFMICACGRHGYIDAGGEETPDDVFCQRDARLLIGELYHDYRITDEERDRLLFEIRESGLPEDIEPSMRKLLELDAELEMILDLSPPPELVRGRTPVGTTEEEYVQGIHELLDMFFPDERRSNLIH